jgi:hypothetical protein
MGTTQVCVPFMSKANAMVHCANTKRVLELPPELAARPTSCTADPKVAQVANELQ